MIPRRILKNVIADDPFFTQVGDCIYRHSAGQKEAAYRLAGDGKMLDLHTGETVDIQDFIHET